MNVKFHSEATAKRKLSADELTKLHEELEKEKHSEKEVVIIPYLMETSMLFMEDENNE